MIELLIEHATARHYDVVNIAKLANGVKIIENNLARHKVDVPQNKKNMGQSTQFKSNVHHVGITGQQQSCNDNNFLEYAQLANHVWNKLNHVTAI